MQVIKYDDGYTKEDENLLRKLMLSEMSLGAYTPDDSNFVIKVYFEDFLVMYELRRCFYELCELYEHVYIFKPSLNKFSQEAYIVCLKRNNIVCHTNIKDRWEWIRNIFVPSDKKIKYVSLLKKNIKHRYSQSLFRALNLLADQGVLSFRTMFELWNSRYVIFV